MGSQRGFWSKVRLCLLRPVAPFNRTTGLLTFALQRKPAYFAYQRAK